MQCSLNYQYVNEHFFNNVNTTKEPLSNNKNLFKIYIESISWHPNSWTKDSLSLAYKHCLRTSVKQYILKLHTLFNLGS